tara:strand:+ start:778 stop:1068 length:291 start_codon:yes stop_codon:yes gene_type:complete
MFERGREKTGGRAKGVQNVATREVKEALRVALERVNPEDYFENLAHEHPELFVRLVSKLIPQEQIVEVRSENIVRYMDYTGGSLGNEEEEEEQTAR